MKLAVKTRAEVVLIGESMKRELQQLMVALT